MCGHDRDGPSSRDVLHGVTLQEREIGQILTLTWAGITEYKHRLRFARVTQV